METTLLIMAAGIGSRFGGGIKQLEPVDSSNHIIMDYSIHDAIEAGFGVWYAYHSYESLICQLEKQWMTDAEQEF